MHPVDILRIALLDNAFFLKCHTDNINCELLKLMMQILTHCAEYQRITCVNTTPEDIASVCASLFCQVRLALLMFL